VATSISGRHALARNRSARTSRRSAYGFLEHAKYRHPEDVLVPFAPTCRKIDDVIDALRAVVLAAVARTHRSGWTCDRTRRTNTSLWRTGCCTNPTRILVPHTARFFNHHALPFAPSTRRHRPRTSGSRSSLNCGAEDSTIQALQEIFGNLLGGDTTLQKVFLMVGPKQGGKGTIGRVLTGLLGAHHLAAPTLASLSTNFGLQPLIGRPLALISDARLSTKADSKIVVNACCRSAARIR
jgi:putative DNA primase/helicase